MVKAKTLIKNINNEDLKKMDIDLLISIQVMKMTELLKFYKSTNTSLESYVDSVKNSDLISEYKSNILEYQKIKTYIEKL